MQYFNSSNSEVEYIKDILRTSYIPSIRVFNTSVNIQPQPEDSYVSSPRDIPLVSTEELNMRYHVGESIILNNSVCIGTDTAGNISSGDGATVANKSKYISNYRFGERYLNITSNFISNKHYYDYDIHENLGRYLRAYRDYYKIDVMNFYNCFSNRFFTSYSLPFTSSRRGLTPYDSKYKLTAFPILFNTPYHIKFYDNVVGDVTFQAIYFNGEAPLSAVEFNPVTGEEDLTPITYTINSKNEIDIVIGTGSGDENEIRSKYDKQRLLYLFMQFPSEINGPIVVLEQPKFTQALNNELLHLSDNEQGQVAFSDTLLEYLTGSVISTATEIHADVARIQHKILQKNFLRLYGVGGPDYVGIDLPNYKFKTGIFDDGLHQLIYKAFFNVGSPVVTTTTSGDVTTQTTQYNKGVELLPNFIGYVDKNVEDLIMRVPEDD